MPADESDPDKADSSTEPGAHNPCRPGADEVADGPADPGAADAAESPAAAAAEKLNNRAFTVAAFGLFLPFIGFVAGIAGLLMSRAAAPRGAAAGITVDVNARNFSLVVIGVWSVVWLFTLIPGLTR